MLNDTADQVMRGSRGGRRRLHATVVNSWQLHWGVLSQGHGIVVVWPKWFREEVAESLRKAASEYETASDPHRRGKPGEPPMPETRALCEFMTRGPLNETFLRSRGIYDSQRDLLELLHKAIEGFAQVSQSDPDQELSASELDALASVGMKTGPGKPGTGAGPVARAAAKLAAFVETSLTVKQVARKLGVDESRVRQRLTRDRSLYGFFWEGKWRIPAFQFDAAGTLLPGLKAVVEALPGGLHPVGVATWFTVPAPDLYVEELERPVAPRDWLLMGLPPQKVAELARDLK